MLPKARGNVVLESAVMSWFPFTNVVLADLKNLKSGNDETKVVYSDIEGNRVLNKLRRWTCRNADNKLDCAMTTSDSQSKPASLRAFKYPIQGANAVITAPIHDGRISPVGMSVLWAIKRNSRTPSPRFLIVLKEYLGAFNLPSLLR